MSSASVSLLLLLVQAAVSAAFYPAQPTIHGSGYENRLCRVPFGFRPRTCGPHEVIVGIVEPACEYIYGPNVCLFTDTIRSNVTEYRYRRGCDWVQVPSHYGGYTYSYQCSHFICQPTHVCLDETQEYNRSYEQCCPGFAARPPKSIYNPYSQYFHYNYYTPINSDPVGCPVAVGNSLLECMEIQGLDEFIKYVNVSDYLSILNTTTDSHLTAFVPTNAALRQALAMNLIPSVDNPFINISMLVGNHLVQGNVTMKSLRQHGAKIYTNLEGRHLHRVSVSFDDRSFIFYPPNPYSYQISRTPTIIKPFINGGEIVIESACNTENGTLHIIDLHLAPTDRTIANFLQGMERFSMFTDALTAVGIIRFLDNPNVSRTVFAIPNEAFAEAFPEDLMTCVSNYLRFPFNNLLLFHISDEAHYTSSLSLQTFFYTLLQQFMKVEVSENGSVVLLGDCKVPIIQSNLLSASNGVIHVVEKPIFPDNFSFGMCQRFVPSPSPAECPETPSPSPTVTPPRVSPLPSMDLFPTSMDLSPTPMPTEPQPQERPR